MKRRGAALIGAWAERAGAVAALMISAAMLAAAGDDDQPAKSATAAAAKPAFPSAARAMSRIAMLDMWQAPMLRERDYRIAALTLENAVEVDPSDEDVLRRLIEAEDSAGRNDRVLEYTRRLVRLAKDDTVAQLRLISASLASLQDVDKRLAAYDKFLGSNGSGLDPSIRSRLAFDAAMLLRERGDDTASAARLSEAIALDPTNKDAAAAAVLFNAERSEDPAARVDMLLVLLKADPMDAETYLALARQLASSGAYKGALRLYRCTADLAAATGTSGDSGILAEMHVIGWCAEGARPKIAGMQDQVESERKRIRELAEKMRKQPGFLGKIPDPNEVQLDVPTSRVLTAAASALMDEALTDWTITELALAVKTATDTKKLQAAPDPNAPAEKAMTAEERKQELADLLWMRLWTGKQIEQAEAQLKELRTDPDAKKSALERMEGWLALRKGDVEGARRILEPLAASDRLAELGLGAAIEVAGDKAKAAEWYAAYYRRNAGSMAGAWARTRAGALTGEVPAPPPEADRLERLIADIPPWLESFATNARSFESVQADVMDMPSEKPFPVEAYPVRIRIRNLSPLPLAVGSERPINSRFLLCPTVWAGKDRLDDTTTMEVVSLARRLRLLPQEAMDVTIRTDNGWLWRKIPTVGDREVKLRWKVVQGFRLTPDHVAVTGPMCLATETSVIGRNPPQMASASAPAVRAAIETGTADQVIQAVGDTLWRWQAAVDKGGFGDDDRQGLAGAIAARYPSMDMSGRVMLLALLPRPSQVPAMSRFEEAVRAERDPTVLAFVLLTRVTDAGDPLLGVGSGAGATGAPAARLVELAGLIRERLADGLKGYAGLADEAKPAAMGNPLNAPEKP